MAKINSFVAKLIRDYPTVRFKASDDFYWSPTTSTVHYRPIASESDRLTLLHETAHALLNHKGFGRDITLLHIEREAWDYVRDTLALRYNQLLDEDFVEDMMDTYREWLHARSRCPNCSMTGIQIDDTQYSCVGCNSDWRVNDARRCGLKRYSLNT